MIKSYKGVKLRLGVKASPWARCARGGTGGSCGHHGRCFGSSLHNHMWVSIAFFKCSFCLDRLKARRPSACALDTGISCPDAERIMAAFHTIGC